MLLLLLIVGAGVIATRGAATSEISPTTNESPADPEAFDEGFLAHLSTVETAVNELVALGKRRERNLLVVGQRQSAMNSALDSTDTWLAQQASFEADPAVVAYRSGAMQIRQAMSDAQAAFLRFDWDAIAAANVRLQAAATRIAEAKSLAAGETT